MSLLEVKNVHVNRKGRSLLTDVSLRVSAGELVGIIGPNGAGKSTLLKTIVGIIEPNQGNIELSNTSISRLSHIQRAEKASYLAQRQQAAFPFTVEETIALGGFRLSQDSPHSTESTQHIIETLAAELDISHLLTRKLDELSGGETQLVHFARILMQRAPLMLLDEPTAALDIGHEAQLMNLLRQHCKEGVSALVAIHNLNIAAAYCDRLLLIDDGRLVASGSPESVITQRQMNQIYEQQVMVSQHPVSGTVTVLPTPLNHHPQPLTVHLIGGAGSTVAIARRLLKRGITVSAGIGHEQDSDTEFWLSTGIDHVKVPAFSAIDDAAIECATYLVQQADITLLCEFPLGSMNEGNLHLAETARNLWVLKNSDDIEGRFYSEQIKNRFHALFANATVLTTHELFAQIEQQLT